MAIKGVNLEQLPLPKDLRGAVSIPWSQKQDRIFDHARGQIVQCSPLPNSLLYISVDNQAQQDHDPMPFAPVAITGTDTFHVHRCGSNLLSFFTKDYIAEGFKVGVLTNGFEITALYDMPAPSPVFFDLPDVGDHPVALRIMMTSEAAGSPSAQLAWVSPRQEIIGEPLGTLYGEDRKLIAHPGEKPSRSARLCLVLYVNHLGPVKANEAAKFRNLQVEIGHEQTPYTPYFGHVYSLSIGRPLYGLRDYPDTLTNDGAAYLRSWFITLNGTEPFNYRLNEDPAYCSVYLSSEYLNALNPPAVESSLGQHFLCSHLPFVEKPEPAYLKRRENMIVGYADRSAAFMMTFERALIGNPQNADDFKAWATMEFQRGTPLTVCYPLATPHTAVLPITKIPALEGINNVFTSEAPTEVSWYNLLPPGLGLMYHD